MRIRRTIVRGCVLQGYPTDEVVSPRWAFWSDASSGTIVNRLSSSRSRI